MDGVEGSEGRREKSLYFAREKEVENACWKPHGIDDGIGPGQIFGMNIRGPICRLSCFHVMSQECCGTSDDRNWVYSDAALSSGGELFSQCPDSF